MQTVSAGFAVHEPVVIEVGFCGTDDAYGGVEGTGEGGVGGCCGADDGGAATAEEGGAIGDDGGATTAGEVRPTLCLQV